MTLGVESGQNIDFKDFRSQNIENKELGLRLWASRQPLAVLSRITPICGEGKVGCHSVAVERIGCSDAAMEKL